MEFDRITTHNWTIAFPADWIDKTQEGKSLYFESPDQEKGFYLSLWNMSDKELRTSEELVKSFQSTEIESFLNDPKNWELLHKELNFNGSQAIGTWEVFNKLNSYRVYGKVISKGSFVLRATFHDYNCENIELSKEFYLPIVNSLELLNA